jgi:hypothetical protein
MFYKQLLIAVFIFASLSGTAQDKYFTKTGKIEFISKAPLEDIEAKNKTVAAILDIKTGALQFSVLMRSFEFEKALMQEHFNDNYVESDKFPKAEFKGTVVNNSAINYTKDGNYPAKVKGLLSIHGVTKEVVANGTIKVYGGKIDAAAVFNILLSDYKIKIPAGVKNKLSNNVSISVDCRMEPLKG